MIQSIFEGLWFAVFYFYIRCWNVCMKGDGKDSSSAKNSMMHKREQEKMKDVSYKNLPDINTFKEKLMAQSVLDIILIKQEEDWLRLTNFYQDYAMGVDMVKIDAGSGGDLYILFSDEGVIIKGFDHESPLSPYSNEERDIAQEIYAPVPKELRELLDDSVTVQDVTFCIWRKQTDTCWHKSEVPMPDYYEDDQDGEEYLLEYLFLDAESWLEWAREWYDEQAEDIKLDDVRKVYEHQEITKELIGAINPDRDFEEVIRELKGIGYIK